MYLEGQIALISSVFVCPPFYTLPTTIRLIEKKALKVFFCDATKNVFNKESFIALFGQLNPLVALIKRTFSSALSTHLSLPVLVLEKMRLILRLLKSRRIIHQKLLLYYLLASFSFFIFTTKATGYSFIWVLCTIGGLMTIVIGKRLSRLYGHVFYLRHTNVNEFRLRGKSFISFPFVSCRRKSLFSFRKVRRLKSKESEKF